MSDRELLELAAKAAGIEITIHEEGNSPVAKLVRPKTHWRYWNPLSDDGDALRLAARLEFTIHIHPNKIGVGVYGKTNMLWLDRTIDDEYDYRNAIVRAAAEIGKAMP